MSNVQEPNGGLTFVGGVRRRVGALADQPDDAVAYEGGCSCGFRTSGWPKKTFAQERLAQHLREHETVGTKDEALTPELAEFKRSIDYDVDVAPAPNQSPFGDDEDPEE